MTILLIFAALVVAFLLGFYTMFITLKKRFPLAYYVMVALMRHEDEGKNHEEKD